MARYFPIYLFSLFFHYFNGSGHRLVKAGTLRFCVLFNEKARECLMKMLGTEKTTSPLSKELLGHVPLLVNFDLTPLKKDTRGTFYFLRHPQNDTYLKIHEEILKVIHLCDGTRSVREVIQEASSATTLSRDQVVSVFKVLAQHEFFKNMRVQGGNNDNEPFTVKKKMIAANSTRFQQLYEVFAFLSSPIAKMVLLLFCGLGVGLFLWNFPTIFEEATSVTHFTQATSPAMLLPLFLVIMYALAILHEFAHAGVYYHQSGEVGEMGVAFHFFMPFLYTKTTKTRSMKLHGALQVFLAGPLVNVCATALFTYLFLLGAVWNVLWALCAYGSALSSLMTLLPFLKGDGYYILQRLVKFPNLMQHHMHHLKMVGKLLLGKISLDAYQEYLSMYTSREKHLLFAYSILFPITIGFLVFMYVFQAFAFRMIEIIALTPQVLSGGLVSTQVYVLWLFYMMSVLFSLIGIITTIYKKCIRREEQRHEKLQEKEGFYID